MKENAIYIPNLNICVKDFYIKDKKVFFVNFDDSVFTSYYSLSNFQTNYIFNTETNICYIQKNDLIPNLGIYEHQFNFLMGLSAILIAYFLNVFSLFFVPIFIYVIALSFVK